MSPAAHQIADAYGVNQFVVVLCGIMYTFNYIPMTFVAICGFRDLRPSVVFRLTCVLALVGAWIRVLSYGSKNFYWILAGWTLLAMAYPVMLTSLTLVCNIWLGDKERTLWT